MPLAKLQYPKTLNTIISGDTSLYSTNLFYSNSPLYNVFSAKKSTYAPPYNLNTSVSNTTITFRLTYYETGLLTLIYDLSFYVDGILYKNNTVINGSNIFLKSSVGSDVEYSFINMVNNSQLGEEYNISSSSLSTITAGSSTQYYLNVTLVSKKDGNTTNPVITGSYSGLSLVITNKTYDIDTYTFTNGTTVSDAVQIKVRHSIGDALTQDVDNYEIGLDINKNQEYLTSPSTVNRLPSLITSVSKKGFDTVDFDLSNIIDNSIQSWKPTINPFNINLGKWIDLFSTNYWQKYVDKQVDPNNTYANKVYQTASTDLTYTTLTIDIPYKFSLSGNDFPVGTTKFDINSNVYTGQLSPTNPTNEFLGFSTSSTPVKTSLNNMFTANGTLTQYNITLSDYVISIPDVSPTGTFGFVKVILVSKVKGDTIYPIATTYTATSSSSGTTYYKFTPDMLKMSILYGTTSYSNAPQQMYFYSLDGREPLFENIDYSSGTTGNNSIQNNLSSTSIIDTNINNFYSKNLTNQPRNKQLNKGYEILCNAKKTIALPNTSLQDKVIFDITYLDNTTERVTLNSSNLMSNQSFYYINQLSFKVNDLSLHTTSGISIDNLKSLDVHFEYPISSTSGYVYETQSYFKDTTIQTCDDINDEIDYLTIVFKNGKGGFDTFEFNEVSENNTVRTIQTLDTPYTWKTKKTSEFSKIWNMTYTKSFKTTSRTLSNAEFQWLEDLIKSKEVYAMHPSTQELYPIIIIDDDYNYKKNTDLTISITYMFSRPESI